MNSMRYELRNAARVSYARTNFTGFICHLATPLVRQMLKWLCFAIIILHDQYEAPMRDDRFVNAVGRAPDDAER